MAPFYIRRKTKESKDFGEVTLAIALSGSIIAVLLKVIDYSNNESLEIDYESKLLYAGLISILLIELSIILSFFVFKGFSEYENGQRKKKFETIAKVLFKLSFKVAFFWFIASILTIIIKYHSDTQGMLLYFLIGLISLGVLVVILYSIKTKDLTKITKFLKNLPTIIITEIKNLSLSSLFFIIIFIALAYVYFLGSSGINRGYLVL